MSECFLWLNVPPLYINHYLIRNIQVMREDFRRTVAIVSLSIFKSRGISKIRIHALIVAVDTNCSNSLSSWPLLRHWLGFHVCYRLTYWIFLRLLLRKRSCIIANRLPIVFYIVLILILLRRLINLLSLRSWLGQVSYRKRFLLIKILSGFFTAVTMDQLRLLLMMTVIIIALSYFIFFFISWVIIFLVIISR